MVNTGQINEIEPAISSSGVVFYWGCLTFVMDAGSDADSGRMSSSTMGDEETAENFVALIEPFYGGSHKQLMDLLLKEVPGCRLFQTPDKKWHWKARTSAPYFAQLVPKSHQFRILFASSVLNLAEFVALRQDFCHVKKILYFHENQLVYPTQEDHEERDFQYGYNQILSALVADVNVFNSAFNMNSFLDNIPKFLSKIPSPRPSALDYVVQIREKSRVLYFPLDCRALCSFQQDDDNQPDFAGCPASAASAMSRNSKDRPLHIVWPHRWEHDKNPEFFIAALEELVTHGCDFHVSIIGQNYAEIPHELHHGSRVLKKYITDFGYLPKWQYYQVLKEADVVVSTARHEFFGVSVMEAVFFGCYPLVPDDLVYPEIYKESDFRYNPSQPDNLAKKLRSLCVSLNLMRSRRPHVPLKLLKTFDWADLKRDYMDLLEVKRGRFGKTPYAL